VYLFEGHVHRPAACALLPILKHFAVAFSEAGLGGNAEPFHGPLDPRRVALGFGEYADGRLIQHDGAPTVHVNKFGSIFLVAEDGAISQFDEDSSHGLSVFDCGLSLTPKLVTERLLLRECVRRPLMGKRPDAPILPEPKHLLLPAKGPVLGVEQGVPLQGARGFKQEAQIEHTVMKGACVRDNEFELDLRSHHPVSIGGILNRMPPIGCNTLQLTVEDLDRAAEILREGGTLAFPTETVYGLGTNALNAAAVEKIFAAKRRPHWDPLIVHVSDVELLGAVVSAVPERARLLMEAFWPGPLTLLLPRNPALPLAVTAGRELVGVRIPAHPVALDLIRRAGVPVAAPSANLFGHVSPTSAAHVLADLDGAIDAVVDGGSTSVGVESTVLDPNSEPMMLYRPGAITLEQIVEVAGPTLQYQPNYGAVPESLPSPGVGIRHYAPQARVILVQNEEELARTIGQMTGARVGVLLPTEWKVPADPVKTVLWASWNDTQALAHGLFEGLRTLDARQVGVILCPLPRTGSGPLAEAIRDRLMKAAKTP
jgi:L-threonylcarbamoyladenylate synthase